MIRASRSPFLSPTDFPSSGKYTILVLRPITGDGKGMKPNETLPTQIVCLVDDDPAVLKATGRLLTSAGFEVRAFSEPENFLAYVAEHPVALVILDIWMEQMNGLEVQAKLSKVSPRTRVIIITGCKDATTEKTAAQFGASGFFTKPFDDEEFLRGVRAGLLHAT